MLTNRASSKDLHKGKESAVCAVHCEQQSPVEMSSRHNGGPL